MSIRTASNPTYQDPLVKSLVGALGTIPTKALLFPVDVHLYVNDVQVSKNLAPGDLTEASFPGYALVKVTAAPPGSQIDGNNRGLILYADFTSTGPSTPSQTVYGFYLTFDADPVIQAAERLDSPAIFAANGDFLSLTICLPEPNYRPSVPN